MSGAGDGMVKGEGSLGSSQPGESLEETGRELGEWDTGMGWKEGCESEGVSQAGDT